MKGFDHLSHWLRQRRQDRQEVDANDWQPGALSEGQLFDWESLAPLFESLDPFEAEFCLLLLGFLEATNQSAAAGYLDSYPVLLVEEASLFLDMIAYCYRGEAQKEQHISDRRALLLQNQRETGADDVLFDFVKMDGHLSASPVDLGDDAFGTITTGKDGGIMVLPVDFEDDEPSPLAKSEEMIVAYLSEGDFGRALAVVIDLHDYWLSNPTDERIADQLVPWLLLFADLVEHALSEGALWHRTMIGDALPALSEDFPWMLMELADEHLAVGNFQQSRKLAQFALFINQHLHGDKHLDTIECFEFLADLYRALGDIEAALAYDFEALHYRAFLEDTPQPAATINRAIKANRESGDHDFARELVERAQESATDPIDVATTLHLNSLLHLDKSEYQAAVPLIEQAVQMRGESLGKTDPEYAASLHLQAVLLHEMGDSDGALPLIEQAIAIRHDELGQQHPDCVTSLSLKAILLQSSGRFLEAVNAFDESTTLETGSLLNVFPTSSDYERKAINERLRMNFHLAMSCFVAVQGTGQADMAPLAFALTLHRKGIEAEMSRLFRARLAVSPAERARLAALQDRIGQLALAGDGYEIRLDDLPQLIIGDYRAQRHILEMEVAADIADELEEEMGQMFAVATPEYIVEQLADGEVLIEFIQVKQFDFAAVPSRGEPKWMPSFYLALVVNPSRREPIAMVKLGEVEAISALLGNYRLAISGEGEAARPSPVLPQSRHIGSSTKDPAEMRAVGKALRKAVFDPLLPALGGLSRLFIVPDGELSRLPFESLHRDDDRYLIDDYIISYLGSSRDLLRRRDTGKEAGAPLVLANPDFGLSSKGPLAQDDQRPPSSQSRDLPRGQPFFGPLPGSEAEGKQIADMLGIRALLGQSALEGQVKRARCPRILHLATHAFFLPNQVAAADSADAFLWQVEGSDSNWGRLAQVENPLLRSGLALAGANTWLQDGQLPEEAEDGLLTAEDVTTMDLAGTDLVVLSACETGLGDIQVGEGVFGLRRAFVLAGARTAVMSLWKVPDQQTQELMVDFYRRILQGQSRATALREAQLALKKRYPDPLYWGAFICQGDPGPVSQDMLKGQALIGCPGPKTHLYKNTPDQAQ